MSAQVPAASEYLPTGHSHVYAVPPAEVAGAVHAVQPSVAVVAVVKVAYSFTAQVMSLQDPSTSFYWPIAHSLSQLAAVPPAEVEPSAHAVQPSVAFAGVVEAEYSFTAQVMSAQVLTVSEYWPTGHEQVVTAPPNEKAGAMHAEQPSVSVVAVSKLAYWSAGQFIKAQVPAGSVYMPFPHVYVHAVEAPAVAVP